MNTNRTNDSVVRDEELNRLQLQLKHLLREKAALELKVLNLHDHAVGRAMEVGEMRFRLVKQAALFSTHDGNHRAHIERLEATLAAVSRELQGERQRLLAIGSSTTWKLGRLLMLPVRIVKRLLRRS